MAHGSLLHLSLDDPNIVNKHQRSVKGNLTTHDTMDPQQDTSDAIRQAIKSADPYRRQGTAYLHTRDDRNHGEPRTENPTGAVVVPISVATTFQQSTPGEATAKDDPNSFGAGYEYSRTGKGVIGAVFFLAYVIHFVVLTYRVSHYVSKGNPTRGAFERATATAENAEYCVAFASGSAATSAVIHLLCPGDHILCIDDVYGGTQRYFRRIVTPQMAISIGFHDFSTDMPFQEATKLVWLETPTNPLLKITDIAACAEKAKQHNCLLAVDNTFCSPYFQTPLDLGADLVVHSVTKYIGGHSDVVMGVVATNNQELYTRLRFIQNGVGAVPSPFDCFLAHRGLKTLHVRMEAAAR